MTELLALLFRLGIESPSQRPLLPTIFEFSFKFVEESPLLLKLIAENLFMRVELTVLSLRKNANVRAVSKNIFSSVNYLNFSDKMPRFRQLQTDSAEPFLLFVQSLLKMAVQSFESRCVFL